MPRRGGRCCANGCCWRARSSSTAGGTCASCRSCWDSRRPPGAPSSSIAARGRAGWLTAGVAVNFASLAFFKYTAFLAGSLAALLGLKAPPISIVLPIGISLLHLPARLLPGRRRARRRALLSLAARHPVRVAVPAPDRRPDRAPPPDHAAARRRPAAARVARALRQGAGLLHHRLRQEGVPRRPDGALCRSRSSRPPRPRRRRSSTPGTARSPSRSSCSSTSPPTARWRSGSG